MAGKFLIKEIAHQAGVSPATVDRVLHQRGAVRSHMRDRVYQAIETLDRQAIYLRGQGRKIKLDIVMEAPARFSNAVRYALEQELAGLPVICHPRFHCQERLSPHNLKRLLNRLKKQGSEGILLKVRNDPLIYPVLQNYLADGVPVISLFTDICSEYRLAYVGMNNQAAGATAAYLLNEWLPENAQNILLSTGHVLFEGEGQRCQAFQDSIQKQRKQSRLVKLSGSYGLDHLASEALAQLSVKPHDISAVYSVGGGNRAILNWFDKQKAPLPVFIGHDLDAENIPLLKAGKIKALLHHDLRQDMRFACYHILQYHDLLSPDFKIEMTDIRVITPQNIPEMSSYL